jgi:hypothetical protein
VKLVLVGFLFCSILLVLMIVPLASEMAIKEAQNVQNKGVLNVQDTQSNGVLSVQNTQNKSANNVQNIQNTKDPAVEFCIQPQNLTLKEGDCFNITVAVENVPAYPGMASAEFHLTWDPTLLNGLSFVKLMFQDNSIGWDELNNSEGLLFYVHALCSGSVAGNQTLEIVTFEAIGQGSTTLHFTYVAACSPDANRLSCGSADGNISVEKGSLTSPPIVSSKPANVLYTMTIFAGSAINKNNLTLPPAIGTENVLFSVNIEIVNATDVEGWDFGLSWNNSVLNCTNVEIYNPSNWSKPISVDGTIDYNFNSTDGRYHIAVAGENPYNGNITIATVTFDPIGTGTTSLAFDQVDVCNSQCSSLKLSTTTGSITVKKGAPS